MPVTSDLVVVGELTGSGTQDTIHTAAGTEKLTVTVFNRSASIRTLKAWINSVADANLIADGDELLTKETLVYELKMGSGDVFILEASGDDVNCFKETDVLS